MKLKDLVIERSLRAKFLGTRRLPIVGIVLHDTAGAGTHNDTRYLAAPSDGRTVSVDFTVERDGSIWQLNPDLRASATFHAGRATKFKGLVNKQVTLSTIGIEIVQKANLSLNPTYPEAQVTSVARLCAALCGELKLASADITTHAAVITDGSRTDPRRFDFDAFWLAFREAGGQGDIAQASLAMTKIPAAVSAKRASYSVKSGDTLTKIAKKFGTTVPSLKTENELKSDLIVVGQSLVVPAP
jgi:N-acetyl-anhydromuramyl-L-alanine amidase AmpD